MGLVTSYQFREARQKAVDLIYELGEFEEDDILWELFGDRDDVPDVVRDSIPRFLQDLRQEGVVLYQNGVYSAA